MQSQFGWYAKVYNSDNDNMTYLAPIMCLWEEFT